MEFAVKTVNGREEKIRIAACDSGAVMFDTDIWNREHEAQYRDLPVEDARTIAEELLKAVTRVEEKQQEKKNTYLVRTSHPEGPTPTEFIVPVECEAESAYEAAVDRHGRLGRGVPENRVVLLKAQRKDKPGDSQIFLGIIHEDGKRTVTELPAA